MAGFMKIALEALIPVADFEIVPNISLECSAVLLCSLRTRPQHEQSCIVEVGVTLGTTARTCYRWARNSVLVSDRL